MNAKRSKFTRKVLLLLMAGVTLGLTRSPQRYFRIIRQLGREWKAINAEPAQLSRVVKNLERQECVKLTKTKAGDWQATITEKGEKRARRYQIEDLEIRRSPKWDGKFRMVIFDIPESKKPARNALNRVLKNAGFYQFQKSVFIHAFECRDEVKFVAGFFHIAPFVKFGIISYLEGEGSLKKFFKV